MASYQYALCRPRRPVWSGARHATPEIFSILRRNGVPLLAWAAQARGWFARTPDQPDPVDDPFDTVVNQARRRRCRHLATILGEDPTTIALAWTLHQRNPHILPIVGPAGIVELDRSLRAATIRLDPLTLSWLADGPGS